PPRPHHRQHRVAARLRNRAPGENENCAPAAGSRGEVARSARLCSRGHPDRRLVRGAHFFALNSDPRPMLAGPRLPAERWRGGRLRYADRPRFPAQPVYDLGPICWSARSGRSVVPTRQVDRQPARAASPPRCANWADRDRNADRFLPSDSTRSAVHKKTKPRNIRPAFAARVRAAAPIAEWTYRISFGASTPSSASPDASTAATP